MNKLQKKQKIQTLLLDLDGTLAQTEPLHYKAYQLACKDFSINFDWSFETFCLYAHGESQGLAKELALTGPAWEQLYSLKKKYYLEKIKTSELDYVPYADNLLLWCKENKKQTAIVTNSPREQLDQLAIQLPLLNTVDLSLTREDYQRPKPAPDGFLMAMNLLNKKFGDLGPIGGFEDTPKGVKALEQAFTGTRNSTIFIVNSEVLKNKTISWKVFLDQYC